MELKFERELYLWNSFMFKSHLYGIEIQRHRDQKRERQKFKSHLYGIEILKFVQCG